MKRLLLGLVLGLWLFILCVKLPERRRVFPVVEQVELYAHHQDRSYRYLGIKQADQDRILNYLRASRSIDTVEKIPMVLPRDSYTVKVRLSNQKCHIYQQVGDRYLRKDNGVWMRLSKRQGRKMKKLEKSLIPRDFSAIRNHYF